MQILPAKDPEEVLTVTFDFTDDLGGEVITPGSPSIAVSLLSGDADPDLASMLSGAAQIQDGKVLQSVRLGLDGRDVKIRCKISTSTQTLVLPAVLPIRTA